MENLKLQTVINSIITQGDSIIFGKRLQIKLALTCFLSRGHFLIEDVPGVGKTTFVKFLAKALDLPFSRIQFTNDLLPSDILGFNLYDQRTGLMIFNPGPVFTNFLLADELNRGSSKTQSALLEAMEEYQVTIDKKTYDLSDPFFVVATQNPKEQVGTNPLPESELDRFMMKIKIGYPDKEVEKKVILNDDRHERIKELRPLIKLEGFQHLVKCANDIVVSSALLDYVTELLQVSRNKKEFNPLSPRSGIDIIKAAKAWCFIEGRNEVLPDDVQAIFGHVVAHRICPYKGVSIDHELNLAQALIQSVTVY